MFFLCIIYGNIWQQLASSGSPGSGWHRYAPPQVGLQCLRKLQAQSRSSIAMWATDLGWLQTINDGIIFWTWNYYRIPVLIPSFSWYDRLFFTDCDIIIIYHTILIFIIIIFYYILLLLLLYVICLYQCWELNIYELWDGTTCILWSLHILRNALLFAKLLL